MARTYDASTLATVARNRVRFLLGDTTIPLASAPTTLADLSYGLTDAEIDYQLTVTTDATEAAAVCCDRMRAKAIGLVSGGDQRGQRSEIFDRFDRLKESIVGRRVPSELYIGGVSEDDADTIKDDADLIQPPITVGGNDYTSGSGGP